MKQGALTIILLLFTLALFAQNKTELEQKRASIQNEINLIGKRLKKTQRDSKTALDNYLSLQRKIQKRAQLIRTLEQEDRFIESRILRTTDAISSLEQDAILLEEEYGVLLRQALREKLSESYLSFIFSAKNFNEAFKRWRYLNQYRSYRARQTQIIKETKSSLLKKRIKLSTLSQEKEKLLEEQRFQQVQLNSESERRNKMYKRLKANEGSLRAELKTQQEVSFQLKNAILDLINTDPKPASDNYSGDVTLDFQRSKAMLVWPVADGLVIRFFGKQQHPTLPKIEIVNNGIDIQANGTTAVVATFSGVVAGKFSLPNGNQSILIRHGEYYTVYSNLAQIFVEKGQQIGTGQEIAQLNPTDPTIHFEVWRQKVRLNPLDWLATQ